MIEQPTLFETTLKQSDIERVLLYALGEFQARGKVLAERQLPLDRLRGAFRRASEKFQTEELSDEKSVEILGNLGAKIVRKPSFVAKHPFRVTVHAGLADRAKGVYQESLNND